MKFVSVVDPIGTEFNWDNARYKIPTTIVVDNKKLDRLEKFLNSYGYRYDVNTRWKTKKKPRAIRQVNRNKWIETIYKNKELQEVILYNIDEKYKENVEYVSE